jgi:hypothetical protein
MPPVLTAAITTPSALVAKLWVPRPPAAAPSPPLPLAQVPDGDTALVAHPADAAPILPPTDGAAPCGDW